MQAGNIVNFTLNVVGAPLPGLTVALTIAALLVLLLDRQVNWYGQNLS